jgi:hypothetical protein
MTLVNKTALHDLLQDHFENNYIWRLSNTKEKAISVSHGVEPSIYILIRGHPAWSESQHWDNITSGKSAIVYGDLVMYEGTAIEVQSFWQALLDIIHARL